MRFIFILCVFFGAIISFVNNALAQQQSSKDDFFNNPTARYYLFNDLTGLSYNTIYDRQSLKYIDKDTLEINIISLPDYTQLTEPGNEDYHRLKYRIDCKEPRSMTIIEGLTRYMFQSANTFSYDGRVITVTKDTSINTYLLLQRYSDIDYPARSKSDNDPYEDQDGTRSDADFLCQIDTKNYKMSPLWRDPTEFVYLMQIIIDPTIMTNEEVKLSINESYALLSKAPLTKTQLADDKKRLYKYLEKIYNKSDDDLIAFKKSQINSVFILKPHLPALTLDAYGAQQWFPENPNWQIIGYDTDDKIPTFIDINSIERNGSSVSYFIKYLQLSYDSIPENKKADYNNRTIIQKNRFDCHKPNEGILLNEVQQAPNGRITEKVLYEIDNENIVHGDKYPLNNMPLLRFLGCFQYFTSHHD